MKKGLMFLLLLIVCFACGTNNKPLSDVQKEKITGEVKEVVSKIIQGAGEADYDLLIGTFDNSPDFVFLYNGTPFTYQQFEELGKGMFATLINQKGEVTDEKYLVLDKSTVLYTANSRWLMNFKDGHAILEDPWAMQYLFRKSGDTWKVVSINESGLEQPAKNSEIPNNLDQLTLMKQFNGTWQYIQSKDTTITGEITRYGDAFVETDYRIVRGQKSVLSIWSYSFSPKDNLFKIFALNVNGSYSTWIGSFIAENKWQQDLVQDFSPSNVLRKAEIVFETPANMSVSFINAEGVRSEDSKWTKIK